MTNEEIVQQLKDHLLVSLDEGDHENFGCTPCMQTDRLRVCGEASYAALVEAIERLGGGESQ